MILAGPAIFAQTPEKDNSDSSNSMQSLQRQLEQMQKEITKRFPMLMNGIKSDSLGFGNMEMDSSMLKEFGKMQMDSSMFKSFSLMFDGQNWKQLNPDSLQGGDKSPNLGDGWNMQLFDPAKMEEMMRRLNQSMTPYMPSFPSDETDPAAKLLKEKSRKKLNKKYETEKI